MEVSNFILRPRTVKHSLGMFLSGFITCQSILQDCHANTDTAVVERGLRASEFSNYLNVIGALILVLIAVLTLAWVAKRLLRISTRTPGPFRVLGSLPLGPRERLLVVEVGKTHMVIGLVPGRIEKLHVLDEPLTETDLRVDGFSAHMAGDGQDVFGPLARVFLALGFGKPKRNSNTQDVK
jgi:flagellar biosynthetic protein FliO